MDEMLAYATKLINRRRNKWTLSTLDFDDARQKFLIHLWEKYEDQFDPAKGLLEHWINSVITNQTRNVLRDNLYKYTRPCISRGGCVFNQGNGACGYTPSGKQCGQCPLYLKWQDKKEAQHNIKAAFTLEHHAQEVNNIQSDFTDYEGAMTRIHAVMMTQLTPFERRLYRMLVIRHIPPAEVSRKLKGTMKKRKLKEGEGIGYQSLLKALERFKQMIVLVIRQEGLD